MARQMFVSTLDDESHGGRHVGQFPNCGQNLGQQGLGEARLAPPPSSESATGENNSYRPVLYIIIIISRNIIIVLGRMRVHSMHCMLSQMY